MSAHTCKAIDKKKLSNGEIAVLMQCCDDPTTNSWHTFSVAASTTTDEISAWLSARQAEVQDHHAAMQSVDAHLDSLLVVPPTPAATANVAPTTTTTN